MVWERMLSAMETIGIDIGRVLIAGDGPDTSFLGHDEERAMRAPAIPHAFATVARLVQLFSGRAWLVSKCGAKIEQRSRRWLELHGFYEATGLDRSKLRFCRTRPEKALIARELGLTCFVDDRRDVILSMQGIVPVRIHFGVPTTDVAGAIAAPGWLEAERAIRESAGIAEALQP